jgi:hypothetical protein
MTVALRFDTRRLRRAVNKVPKELTRRLTKAFLQHGEFFKAEMIKSKPFKGGTGTLLRSIRSRTTGKTINNLKLRVTIGGGVASKYVGIQETGGTIFGRPWLTVPLPDNKTAAGNVRFKSARALQNSTSVKTFLAKMPSGKLLIGRTVGRGRNKRVQWLWVLKRSVRLKPRLGYFKMWKSRPLKRDRVQRFRKAVRLALASSTTS